jgi:hypothetical protein
MADGWSPSDLLLIMQAIEFRRVANALQRHNLLFRGNVGDRLR